MTPGEWMEIATVLVAVGGSLARLAQLATRVTRLEQGAAAQGGRIGDLKLELAEFRTEVRTREQVVSEYSRGYRVGGDEGGRVR